MPAFRIKVGLVVNPRIHGLAYKSRIAALSAPSAKIFTRWAKGDRRPLSVSSLADRVPCVAIGCTSDLRDYGGPLKIESPADLCQTGVQERLAKPRLLLR